MTGFEFNYNEPINRMGLMDVGTRYQHLRELVDLWELGIEIMDKYNYRSDVDKIKRLKLENAIEMMKHELDRMAGVTTGLWELRPELDKIEEERKKNVNL